MTDPDLLSHLQTDRAAGMEALLRQYGPLLRYVINGVLRNVQDTEDCFSEVSLLLWQKLDVFDPARGTLTTWLTAVARNAALNHQRARQRRDAHLAEASAEPLAPTTPEGEVLRRERMERLRRAIGRLSERDRQLFYRKYYYLQPLSQIAAEMGLSERAAEGRLYRLRLSLRRELGGDGT